MLSPIIIININFKYRAINLNIKVSGVTWELTKSIAHLELYKIKKHSVKYIDYIE